MLKGKKESIVPLEQEVDDMLRDFEKSMREMLDGLARLPG
jgi:site-specific recombinase XerD